MGEFEIAVVGGGIVGLSASLHLARAGREVAVVERGDPWSESSGMNAGSLGVLNMPPAMLGVTLKALELWRGMAADLGADVGYVESGSLCVATTDAEAAAMEGLARRTLIAGEPCRWYDRRAIRDTVPWMGEMVQGAAFCPVDGFSSPMLTGPALISAVRRSGGAILARAAVTGIGEENGRLRLETAAGPVRCRRLVIAAGVWSGALVRMLGLRIPVYVDVNMLSVTEPGPPVMTGLVTHAGGSLSLKQFANGTCVIGGGWQGRGNVPENRRDPDYANLLHNLRFGAAVAPGLAGLRLVRSWAGYEGLAPDALPLFGPLPGRGDILIASCVRGGFLTGPAIGWLMAQLVLEGRTELPVEAFRPGRFAA